VVRATRAAATASLAPGQVYNVGGGSRVTLRQALEALAAVSGRPLDLRWQGRQHGDVSNTGADISRARADLGFVPEVSLEDGLRAE
jgi:UDP-glucose 4-epimerase